MHTSPLRSAARLLLGAFVFLVVVGRVWPTTFTWIGGDVSGEVGLTGNWLSGTAPAGDGLVTEDVDFGDLTGVQNNIILPSGGFILNDLAFNNSAPTSFTLSGTSSPTFQLTGGINTVLANGNVVFDNSVFLDLTAGTHAFAVGTGHTLEIQGPISGAGGINKTGNGTLSLAPGNTYSGLTQISSGTLRLLGSGSFGPSGIAVAGAGTFNLNGNSATIASLSGSGGGSVVLGSQPLTLDQAVDTTFDGIISGTGGSLTKTGIGTLTLSGPNSYTGGTTISGGTVALSGNGALNNNIVGGTASGTLDITGAGGGGGIIGGLQGTVNVTLGTKILNVNQTANTSHAGVISGADGSLIKQGAGQLTLTGVTTLTGFNSVTVNGGSLVVSGTGRLNLGTSSNVNAGQLATGTLSVVQGGQITAGSISVGGAVAAANSQLTVTDVGSSVSAATGGISLGTSGSNGTLLVAAGAHASGFNLNIGQSGSNNQLIVTGTGSQLAIGAGQTYVGTGGSNNSLSLVAGGVATAAGFNIGKDSGPTGGSGNAVSVSGAGSMLTVTGALGVGAVGNNNSLTVANGGVVNANGGVALASTINGTNSSIALTGTGVTAGELSTTSIVKGAGTGTVTFDGGRLTATATAGSLFSGFSAGEVQIASGGAYIQTSTPNPWISVALQGTGALTKFGPGSLTLQAANTYFGDTHLLSGTIVLSAAGSFANSGLIMGAGTTLNIAPTSAGATIGGLAGTGSASILLGSQTLTVNQILSGTLFLGTITGTGSLVKGGTGELIFGGTGNFSGGVKIKQSALTLAGGSLGMLAPGFDFTVGDVGGDTGTLNVSGGALLSNLGSLGKGSGASGTASLSSGSWNNAGNIVVGDAGTGVLTLSDTATLTAGAIILANASGSNGTLNIGAGGATGTLNTGTVLGGAGTATVNFNHSSTLAFAANLDGLLTVNKSGAGLLELTGPNYFTGTANVTAGALRVSGSMDNANVMLSGGTTLSGNGSIGGSVTVANGAIVAPGASPGTLAVGSLVLNSTSILNYELATPNVVGGGVNDLINVASNLTLDGTLNVTDAGGFAAGSYRLINYGGVLTNNTLNLGSLPSGLSYGISTATAGQVNLVVDLSAVQFWDGGAAVANGSIDGGAGTWDAAGTNWTGANGLTNGAWGAQTAVFGGTAGGVVTLAAPQVFQGLQFTANGYTVAGSVSNTLTPTSGGSLTVDAGITAVISAPLVGGGSISKAGPGTLTLSGNNTFTGGTTIAAGTLALGSSTALGTGSLMVASGGTLDLNNWALTLPSLSGAGNYVLTGNSLTVGGDNSSTSHTGVLSGTGTLVKDGTGTLTLSGANTYSGGTGVLAGTLAGDATSLQGDVTNLGVVNFDQLVDGIYAGVMSGAGSLTKIGGGVLTLTGANTYLGATTIATGTLRVNGSLANTAVAVASGATLGGSGTIGGAVTVASGGIIAPGNSGGTLTVGTLTLNSGSILNYELSTPAGVNDLLTITGDLTLAGTLNVTDVGGFGAGAYRLVNYGGTLTNNGLAFGSIPAGASLGDLALQTSTAGQVNLVYGAPVVPVTPVTPVTPVVPEVQFWNGSGTWNGDSTNWEGLGWGGRTAVFTGTPGQITLNGPITFETIQFMNSGFVLAPGTNAALVPSGTATFRVDPGASAVINVPITGSGGITKVDAGMLTLGGNNTYTGATRISGGTVALDNSSLSATEIAAGATLKGNGTIRGNLVNNGTVSPGFSPGTITVQGNYTQASGAKYQVELASASSYDRLIVTGTATLDGTLEVSTLPGFTVAAGQTYPILTAGSVTGKFATVTSPFTNLPLGLRFDTLYRSTGVDIGFFQRAYTGFAGTPNQNATAAALDAAATAGNISAIQAALNSSADEAGIRRGLNQLSPQRYDRWFGTAVASADSLSRTVREHLGANPAAGRTAWSEVIRSDADFDGSADVGSASVKTNGIVAGLDQVNADGAVFGGLLAYDDTTIDSGGRVRVKSFQPGVQARYTNGPWHTSALLAYARQNYEARREIALPGYAQVAQGETDGHAWVAGFRADYEIARRGWTLTPSVGVQYVNWSADDFTETGAGQANLSVRNLGGRSFASLAAVRGAWTAQVGRVALTPYVELGWRHEFNDDAHALSAQIGGTSFAVQGIVPSAEGWNLAAGFDAALRDNLSLYAQVHREEDTAVTKSTDFKIGMRFNF